MGRNQGLLVVIGVLLGLAVSTPAAVADALELDAGSVALNLELPANAPPLRGSVTFDLREVVPRRDITVDPRDLVVLDAVGASRVHVSPSGTFLQLADQASVVVPVPHPTPSLVLDPEALLSPTWHAAVSGLDTVVAATASLRTSLRDPCAVPDTLKACAVEFDLRSQLPPPVTAFIEGVSIRPSLCDCDSQGDLADWLPGQLEKVENPLRDAERTVEESQVDLGPLLEPFLSAELRPSALVRPSWDLVRPWMAPIASGETIDLISSHRELPLRPVEVEAPDGPAEHLSLDHEAGGRTWETFEAVAEALVLSVSVDAPDVVVGVSVTAPHASRNREGLPAPGPRGDDAAAQGMDEHGGGPASGARGGPGDEPPLVAKRATAPLDLGGPAGGALALRSDLAASGGRLGGLLLLGGSILAAIWAVLRGWTKDSKDPLALPSRNAVYEAIVRQPGCRVVDVARMTRLDRKTCQHHIKRLKRDGLVEQFEDSLYPMGRFSEVLMKALATVRAEPKRRFLEFLREHPDSCLSQVKEELGKAHSTAHYHKDDLRAMGLVGERRVGKFVHLFIRPDAMDAVIAAVSQPRGSRLDPGRQPDPGGTIGGGATGETL